jgi:hypothetical protein
MKTIKSLVSLLGILILTNSLPFTANAGDENDAQDALRTQVLKWVKEPDLRSYGVAEEQVFLKFLVTDSYEIVVLSTGTNNDYLDLFIKKNLNYKRVKPDPQLKKGKYNIEILFRTT